jgi:glutaredoxin
LKKKLETDEVQFTEKNVDEDQDAMIDLLMKGLCTVPVLIINGKVQETQVGSPTLFSGVGV